MGRRAKKDSMQVGTFAELMEAAEQALAYERGEGDDYRVVQVESLMSSRRIPADEASPLKSKLGPRRKHKNPVNS